MINKNPLILLPTYFKKIGLVVIVLAIVTGLIIHNDNHIAQSQKKWGAVVTFDFFIIGLLFIAWSKDKVEDEMTIFMRLKAIAFTFSWIIITTIISPFIDLIFRNPFKDATGQHVLMSMLFFYLLTYYFQKLGR